MPDRATDDLAERLRVMSRDELATAIKAAIDQRDNRITALTARLAANQEALRRVDHTLSLHGHIDADTPLHEAVRLALTHGGENAE